MHTSRRSLLLRGVLLVTMAITSLPASSQTKKETTENMAATTIQGKTLYHRLGGYDAIAAVTDDFVGRLVANKNLSRFFGGTSNDSKKRIRQLIVDQLCALTGGPCLYIGRDMKTAHAGMEITETEWNAAVNDLLATLEKFKVPTKEWKHWQQDNASKGFFTLRADEGLWQPIDIDGIRIKRLAADTSGKTVTMLIRMDPGTEYPSHRHADVEECFVLEGDLRVGDDLVLHAGDYQRADRKSVHPRQWTKGGCLLFLVSSTEDEILE